jgi:hypothetical protein
MRKTKEQRQRERDVLRLSATLRPLSEAKREWAMRVVIPPVGFVSGGAVWCSECGERFTFNPLFLSPEVEGDKEHCPHCGALLTLEKMRKKKREESVYFSVLDVREGWQVVRHFVLTKEMHRGAAVNVGINEGVQEWINEAGDVVRLGRPIVSFGTYYKWDYRKPLRIVDADRSPADYIIWAYHTAPCGKVLPRLRRNGYTARIDIMPPSVLFRLLLTDPEAEWMCKTKQWALLKFLKYEKNYKAGCLPYSWAYKIANRHGYKITDPSVYLDYLDLLAHFHLDTHNPRYICPKNLHEEHDKLTRRKAIEDARRKADAQTKDIEHRTARYQQTHAPYLGLAFGDDTIRVAVLPDVLAFKMEGDAMHHCVFTNKYDERPDTLILSAKDTNGERIATIELNLDTLQVVQCRGKCNQEPPRKAEILQLIQQNTNEIARRRKSV